ncbi:hypothetical protein [Halocynthiibacter namhaensis]|uniref:hypothetical protein n=1 Tax=Halocynthiibacter namhaensis TaxID=1290553 RepID=UPI0012E03352|nr:hypothetical protein [Halocynthiibacter namhaensis]
MTNELSTHPDLIVSKSMSGKNSKALWITTVLHHIGIDGLVRMCFSPRAKAKKNMRRKQIPTKGFSNGKMRAEKPL